MPINQERLKALTPEDIRGTARSMRQKEVQAWYTEIDGVRYPSLQLIKEAAHRLQIQAPALHGGTTTHEAVAVLSHNGFTSRNASWE